MRSALVRHSDLPMSSRTRRPRAVAILVAAAIGLSLPATASAIDQSTLTLTTSASVITWGDSFGIKIAFGALGASRIVVLQNSRDALAWENIYTLNTDANGNASYTYRPATNRYYRAVFQGAPDLAAVTSNVSRVVVRQLVILKPTSNGRTTIVSVGKKVTFTLSVRPSRPELLRTTFTLAIYRSVSGAWRRFTTRDVAVDPYGNATYTWTFGTRGEWYVRAIANPTPDNANSAWSQIERYSVR